MSAPPLPEVFGNYALGDFVEVVPPGAIDWLPQTLGWQITAIMAASFSARTIFRKLRSWYQNRYRREAAERLRKIEQITEGDKLIMELNRLLKLTALVAYSRETVAKLSGAPWADFLNDQCAAPVFTSSQMALLAKGSYQRMDIDKTATDGLLEASAQWIVEHRDLHNV
ncbi:MAG: DUF4381 domain-containing protein [Halioglobus sp.]